jgi:transglutaminase-like putative cysteine protease
VGTSLAKAPTERKLRLNFICEIDRLPIGAQVVDVWIPVPPSNERQAVELLNARDLEVGRFATDKTFGNRLYYRRFEIPKIDATASPPPARSLPLHVEMLYDVEVREASVAAAKQLIATESRVPADTLASYLRETRMIPLRGRIAELARGIPLPEGEPLRAGRKIYDYLVDTMVYNYRAPGAGQGDAVWACDSKTGDCTDFHSVFIGVCRWRGIPADHVFGLPIPPEKPEGDVTHCHCWAQFWVAGVGWIPIDASRANKYPKDRDYYFGTLGSTWLTLAHGRDVVLEPPQKGPPLNMLHGPVAEVDGKPFDGLRWLVHYKEQPRPTAR